MNRVKTPWFSRLEWGGNGEKVRSHEAAQNERILITRDGKPIALVVGLENYDDEDWEYMSSRPFWEMIRDRRQRPTVPLKDVRAELLADDPPLTSTSTDRKAAN